MTMEVLDLIYYQSFFTANSLGRQLTTSQFFQPLAPQMLALVAAAIHCALSEYAMGKKVTVMFSQDKYRGKFCPSPVMDCITAETTALINYTWWGYFIPPMVLLCDNRRSSIPIGAPQSELALQYFIQRSLRHFCQRTSRMDAPRPQSGAPQFHSRLFASLPFRDAQHRWAAPLEWPFLAWICALNFIPHSSITIITPFAHPALHIRHSSFPGGASCFPPNSSYCIPNSILIDRERTSQFQPFRYHKSSQTTLEFNFAHSPGPNHSVIQGVLQLLCAVNELCVPVFVSPDEIGDLVDDIETMFD